KWWLNRFSLRLFNQIRLFSIIPIYKASLTKLDFFINQDDLTSNTRIGIFLLSDKKVIILEN
ncbi:hypothetical protein AEM00_00655, partial [Lactobacillus crispatus]